MLRFSSGECMNQSGTEGKIGIHPTASTASTARLTGHWLAMARVAWLVLVVPSLGLFVASLVLAYHQLHTVCVDPVTCTVSMELPVSVQQALARLGLSVSGFAALLVSFFAITAAIWDAVGFLIFWRRSEDWLALLAALFLVLFNTTTLGNTFNALVFASPVFTFPLALVSFLGEVAFGLFFLLFPGGRLVPRWMWPALALLLLQTCVVNFPSPSFPYNATWPGWLALLPAGGFFGAIIFSQIYRYRRMSTPLQRQQTKWMIFGVTVAVTVVIGILAVSLFTPTYVPTNAWGAVTVFLWPLALLLIPLSIGFSILRYRLYDIDVLINRTLVYGTLTVLLVLIYAGLVIGLGALLRLLPGQLGQSPVVIVVSTLAIAALFQPLRHRLQAVIDRRFYRRKYDAAKIMAAFSASLRNEVDLATLSEHLVAVVKETMQPAHLSLWLRPPVSPSRNQAPWRATPADPSKGEAREEW